MDLRHMRHFVAVAEELHFGRAARRLNMAQPPLSQSIRRLELDIGTDLFDRSRRGVELTPAGRAFLEEARRTLAQADLARRLARRAAEDVPEVRVSFVGPALYRLLPEIIARFRIARPDVHLRLYERSTSEQEAGLIAASFDVAFVTAVGFEGDGCDTLVVERSRACAAVPADWEIARKDSVSLVELAELPFIVPPQTIVAQGLDSFGVFKEVGVMPRIAQEAVQTNTVLSLIGVGVGCSLLPYTASLMRPRNVRFIEIETTRPNHSELLMAWHRQHVSPLGREFVAFVQEHLTRFPELLNPNAPLDQAE